MRRVLMYLYLYLVYIWYFCYICICICTLFIFGIFVSWKSELNFVQGAGRRGGESG